MSMFYPLISFQDLFNDPTMVLDALDGLTDTLKDDPAMGADGRFSHSITRHLFETEPKTGFDLVALNIQVTLLSVVNAKIQL